ncbi:MAG: hypothetical protein ACREDO_06095 [Methyloceanibacter sp.]
MLRRVAIGACLICLMGGAAQAVENSEMECIENLANAEEAMHQKIEAQQISEADAEKLNELLDEADALCTEGKFKEATATLDKVTSVVGQPVPTEEPMEEAPMEGAPMEEAPAEGEMAPDDPMEQPQ